MGLFDRLRAPADPPWTPPLLGSCACAEHVELLHDHPLPLATARESRDTVTVGELVAGSALDARPAEPEEQWRVLAHSGQRIGPFHWMLKLGDQGRALYDDAAPAALDDTLSIQPGVERVAREDPESFLVGAPTLCASGLKAAMVRALDNPRVRPMPD